VTDVPKKLPKPAPLSNPQITAALNNDANADGKPSKGILQDLTMMTNVNSGPLKSKPGEVIKNPIISPMYDKPKRPIFEMEAKGTGSQASAGKSSKSGSGSKSGSTTESETSVGSMGETGTKVGGFKGLSSNEGADIKTTSDGPDMPFAFVDSSVKARTDGQDIKSFQSDSNSMEFSFNHKDFHNDLPDSEIAGSRPYQTVSDIISDEGKMTECPDGRNCIKKDQSESDKEGSGSTVTTDATKQAENITDGETKNMITDCKLRGDCKTEATSKDVAKAKGGNLAQKSDKLNLTDVEEFKQLDEAEIQKLSPKERLHKFFGSITLDNKNVYKVVGTAEVANLEENLKLEDNGKQRAKIDTDIRKHNIGFNVMLPSHLLKHFASPRFKEHSKLLGPKGKKIQVENNEGSVQVRGGMKKLIETVADANKRKLVTSSKEPHVVINKASIATVNKGESGDIGATKPLQGLLLEAKTAKKAQGDLGASAPGKVDLGTQAGKSETPVFSKESNVFNRPIQNNLGSIVTLVGKVKSERLGGKSHSKAQKKQSNTTVDTHKKTAMKERPDVKHMKHNSSETNAANIAETGPSNSIIVSSVIVVIIASFVVVGMAVVAIVSVVARYCRLGKRLDAS